MIAVLSEHEALSRSGGARSPVDGLEAVDARDGAAHRVRVISAEPLGRRPVDSFIAVRPDPGNVVSEVEIEGLVRLRIADHDGMQDQIPEADRQGLHVFAWSEVFSEGSAVH